MTRPKQKLARGLACPKCLGPSVLLYTRTSAARVVRRRTCATCGKFSTIERPVGHAGKEKSVGVTTLAQSVTDLLQSLGLTPTDLTLPATLPLETTR